MATLEARVLAYRDNLLTIADQLEDLVITFEQSGKGTAAGLEELNGSVRMYRSVADDLTKVINDEPLEKFAVVGEV